MCTILLKIESNLSEDRKNKHKKNSVLSELLTVQINLDNRESTMFGISPKGSLRLAKEREPSLSATKSAPPQDPVIANVKMT